ncbi:MAG TPA: squalene--hopene cyclase [Caldilineae bacterium]|nr:squalene--hopene cyclase [Caldilineae bacterium]
MGLEVTVEIDLDLLQQAIRRAQEYLLGLQKPEGYWIGELEADASVTAGYIPVMHFMGRRISEERKQRIIQFLKSRQNTDGSWPAYHGGPGDLSVSVQVYFALKLAGVSAEEPFMKKAREFIRARGGVARTNVITRVWLACFGQFPWSDIPIMPPELIFLPKWFYFNIYEFSSWARATIMALALLSHLRPLCPVPEGRGVEELYLEGEWPRPPGHGKGMISWENFYLVVDRILKAYQKSPIKPGRGTALRKVEEWVVAHQDADGSWGGILLPWVYSLYALKELGYPDDHPVIQKGLEGLEDFILEDEERGFRLQPAVSPIWDTAWAIIALRDSGLPPDHPALLQAARWLLKKEIRVKGDWAVKNPRIEPGGWAFEFENNYYPDIDDSAVVPLGLLRVKLPESEEPQKLQAIRRAANWVAGMQSSDGGWAAFDKDNNKRALAHIPFADFVTPLDPTSPDVTSHAIEFLSAIGGFKERVRKGVEYLKNAQEADGAWFGRWGVNYIYGTGLVLPALKAAGEDVRSQYIQEAVRWLKSHQNEDGGWGESCASYDDPHLRGQGPSTASQTAWALLGLIAAGEAKSPEVRKGVRFLLETQREDGSWEEEAFTGTGFPRAFYLRYHLYPVYFPLLALARYQREVIDNENNENSAGRDES